jgi:hypothetical protein
MRDDGVTEARERGSRTTDPYEACVCPDACRVDHDPFNEE